MGLSFLLVRLAEGESDGDCLADLSFTVVLWKTNATAMSMGAARNYLEKNSVIRYSLCNIIEDVLWPNSRLGDMKRP